MQFDFSVLNDVAENDDLTPTNLKGEMASAYQKAVQKAQEKRQEELGEQLVLLIQHREKAMGLYRTSLRSLRQQEKDIKSTMKELDRSFEYGNVTNDFRPAAALLGLSREHHVVPPNWTPPTTEE